MRVNRSYLSQTFGSQLIKYDIPSLSKAFVKRKPFKREAIFHGAQKNTSISNLNTLYKQKYLGSNWLLKDKNKWAWTVSLPWGVLQF